MSIKNRRLQQAVDNIIKEELQLGELPSSNKVITRINTYTQMNDLSKPSFNPKTAIKGRTISSDEYSESLTSIKNDLDILYSSAIYLINENMNKMYGYEIERRKLEYQLDKMEDELRELVMLYSDSGALDTVFDSFADMSKVDVSKTTAHINIDAKEVTISNEQTVPSKINIPNGSAINFTPFPETESVDGKTISGSLYNIISQSSTEVWKREYTSNSITEIGGWFYIIFPRKLTLNRMMVALHTVKASNVRIEFTADDTNWLPLPYYESKESYSGSKTYEFPSMAVSQFRIAISKSEPDNTTSQDDIEKYTYILGVREISFYSTMYSNKSVLISTPLQVRTGTPIDKVSLDVTTDPPLLAPGTFINYYLAIAEENPDWIQVSPIWDPNPKYDQIADFKNIENAIPPTFSFLSTKSISERELPSLNANGIKFYELGRIGSTTDPVDIVPGTEKLYRGKGCFKMETMADTNSSDYSPLIEDWASATVLSSTYINIDTNKPSQIISSTSSTSTLQYRLTSSIYADEEIVLSGRPLTNCPITIYLNGNKIFSGMPTGAVNFKFQKGWNDLVILMFKHSSVTTATLDLNIDIMSIGNLFYAESKPMTIVSLFDLRYNISNTNKNCYAITKLNDSNIIVLNHYIYDIEYEFYYKYSIPGSPDKILFKAELGRDSDITDISPKLKSYRLRFSV